jgi:hypothetical protein
VGEEAKGWGKLMGAVPMTIHTKNNMRGKHPTEEGVMAMPLDWGRSRQAV